ncbi:unnamed protein product [Eruca vesicaria subsp. sativa]|uniref:ACT domain-containing protein ACR n=1 Tax=Eruca vesicaria subsp. sativa TaxID=29727 RepID=A0ABC8IUL8_ERUVS|nr:unnamed protein product [Eruca vesicaria subsp. sativa]
MASSHAVASHSTFDVLQIGRSSQFVMSSLMNLGLNVVKVNVYLDSSGKHNKIFHYQSCKKVEDPELLEAIRLTVINNMLELHSESSSQFAMEAAFGVLPPTEQVKSSSGLLFFNAVYYIETTDRPGLLVELVKIISDINIVVESGEFGTEGLLAKVKFHITYRNKALIKLLQQDIANSLRYFLKRPSTDESSF